MGLFVTADVASILCGGVHASDISHANYSIEYFISKFFTHSQNIPFIIFAPS